MLFLDSGRVQVEAKDDSIAKRMVEVQLQHGQVELFTVKTNGSSRAWTFP